MKSTQGQLRVAASDLSNFLACRHLTRLDSALSRGTRKAPRLRDVGLTALAERGEMHETAVRERFVANGWRVEAIPIDWEHPEVSAAITRELIEAGVDVIDQGVFLEGDRYGRTDFLIRADLIRSGANGYEVVDAKLARSAKAKAVLQIAYYSRLLAKVQSFEPEMMHLALGGEDELQSFRVAAFGAYERQVDRLLTEFLATDEAVAPTYPDPNEHCVICRWRVVCSHQRHEDDDLSLVAGISSRQRKALKEVGISTLEAFAELDPLPQLQRVNGDSLARSHAQAAIQLKGRRTGQPEWELVPPERDDDGVLVPNRGLLGLPEPADGDLFFDIEGARFYSEDGKEFGLQYLFGIVDTADLDEHDQPRYHEFWSFDRTGEKQAFEQLVDFIVARRVEHPDLHVYHYNHYEPTNVTHLADLHETREEIVGRLMGRFATHEDEVDDLFRQSVFVDLYRVVRQGVRASVESYSIKRLEDHCGYERVVALPDVNERMVLFEAALDDGHAEQDVETQAVIAGYNEDDCRSTLALREWLEARRLNLAEELGHEVPRPEPPDEPEDHTDPGLLALRAALLHGIPDDGLLRTPEQAARVLTADLLEWHRREDKPKWWRWFYLLRLDDDELIGERDAIAGLEFRGVAEVLKQSELVRFSYPPQEHPFKEGDSGLDRDGGSWSIVEVNEAEGSIVLKRGLKRRNVSPTCLIDRSIVNAPEQRARLRELGERVRDLSASDWPSDAALDLLRRQPPRVAGGGPLRHNGEAAAEAGARLALTLERSVLPIQGPPGTGKTYTGARQILELVRAGKKVGVTATSHSVICNLLDEAHREAEKESVPIRIGQKVGDDHVAAGAEAGDHVFTDNAAPLAALRDDEIDVLGGTAWLWSRQEFANSVDVLIVDEASQVSLANTLALTHAATNLVLLGDPQQLGQPSQASHPPGADASALGHILGDEITMPDDRGLFIERTRRMHPDVCKFTSEVFYEGRLEGIEGLEQQAVLGAGDLSGTGLRFWPVPHEGNTNDSLEEAEVVASLVNDLRARRWRRQDGSEGPVTDQDVLVVTPYNAQIREIEQAFRRLGVEPVRVGTVDKFQGRQGSAVIYSMASSSVEEAPRGTEFLFDLHRLNVATSRARCLAVVVASPELLRVMCKTPRQMELVNALCRFQEMSKRIGA